MLSTTLRIGASRRMVKKFGIGYVADEWDLVRGTLGTRTTQAMLVSAEC